MWSDRVSDHKPKDTSWFGFWKYCHYTHFTPDMIVVDPSFSSKLENSASLYHNTFHFYIIFCRVLSHSHLGESFPTCEIRQDKRHYFNFIDEKIGAQSSELSFHHFHSGKTTRIPISWLECLFFSNMLLPNIKVILCTLGFFVIVVPERLTFRGLCNCRTTLSWFMSHINSRSWGRVEGKALRWRTRRLRC